MNSDKKSSELARLRRQHPASLLCHRSLAHLCRYIWDRCTFGLHPDGAIVCYRLRCVSRCVPAKGKLVLLCAGRERHIWVEKTIVAKLKVYGGITYGAEGQFRTVVAATSKSKAASILNITIYQMNSWWTETFNKYEVEAAMSEPGAIFSKPLDGRDPFVKQEG
jgi:hypothetical protein